MTLIVAAIALLLALFASVELQAWAIPLPRNAVARKPRRRATAAGRLNGAIMALRMPDLAVRGGAPQAGR